MRQRRIAPYSHMGRGFRIYGGSVTCIEKSGNATTKAQWMAKEVTEEQRRLEYTLKLGELAGGLFSSIYKDFVVLKLEWRIFSEFFRAYPERIEVLNEASGTTALIFQNALRERVILKICRLIDPAKLGRNENASLAALFEASDMSDESMVLLKAATSNSKVFRDLRNKSIAHRDIEHAALNIQFDGISYSQIDNRIELIARTIKAFAEEKLNTTLILNVTSSYGSDEVSFLHTLYLGTLKRKELQRQRHELLTEGKYDELDKIEQLPDWLTNRKFDIFD